MTRQIINTGGTASDGTGDTLREAGRKINANFEELYGAPYSPVMVNDNDSAAPVALASGDQTPGDVMLLVNPSSHANDWVLTGEYSNASGETRNTLTIEHGGAAHLVFTGTKWRALALIDATMTQATP